MVKYAQSPPDHTPFWGQFLYVLVGPPIIQREYFHSRPSVSTYVLLVHPPANFANV